MKRKLLALVLSSSMLLGMTGNVLAAEAELPAWMSPCEEEVTLTVAREALSFELPEGNTLEDNIWTREFQNRFNVKLETLWISDDYETKLNLSIASGELPDVFTVTASQLNQLIDAGMLMDITEIYEKDACDQLRVCQEGEPAIFDTAVRDGKLYGIPSYNNGTEVSMLWLRQDWMKELGKEFPTTIEELEEIMVAMKDLTGGYSLAVDQSLDTLYTLATGWGAYPTIWVENEEGNIVYGATMPEMKEALQTWARWYEEGIIAEDFATMNADAMKEDIISGYAGAQGYANWWGWSYATDMTDNLDNDEAYFLPCEVPTVSGDAAVYPKRFQNDYYIVINKDCEHPEAVMKLVNFYASLSVSNMGIMTDEEVSEFFGDNMAHAVRVFQTCNIYGDYNKYDQVKKAFVTGDTSVLTSAISKECYEGAMLWITEKDRTKLPYQLQVGEPGCGLDVQNTVIDSGRFVQSELWGASPQVLLDYGSTLDDILQEGFTKIIMGAEPIEYFDTLIEQWQTAGGEEVTEAINEMYK